MKNWSALAAMAENRVIGNGPNIPWHLPEDFKWFKQKTIGHTIVMGRKTFESIGRPLPKRTNIIVSRQNQNWDGTQTINNLESLEPSTSDKQIFICGGAEIYKMALPYCQEIFMTHVKGSFTGDILFPPFEDDFEAVETIQDNTDFTIIHYKRK